MRILGIDSSGLVASVAVADEEQMIAEYTVNYKKTHSQTLLPMLDEIVKMVELDLGSIDAIAVAAGPGSFTGLRIGSATAKGLGLALGKPVISVPTMEGIAYNMWGTDALVVPLMDARRSQVYTGIYEFCDGQLHQIEGQMAVPVAELIGRVNGYGRKTVFLGDGAAVFRQMLEASVTVPFSFAPSHMNRQRAASVAALAFVYAAQGKTESAAEHRPDYLKLSQAERERAQKDADSL